MKAILLFLVLILFIGCSSTKQTEVFSNLPVLLDHEALPVFPVSHSSSSLNVDIKMQIDEKGNVCQAQFQKGSGAAEWDSLAIKSIKNWKFDPARVDGKPFKMWIVQHAVINAADPYYLSFAEIMCDSREKALDLFAQLKEGKDFGQLASEHSTGVSKNQKGVLDKIDVNAYPSSISFVLKRLSVDQYTEPMQYGKKFVIYKRIQN